MRDGSAESRGYQPPVPEKKDATESLDPQTRKSIEAMQLVGGPRFDRIADAMCAIKGFDQAVYDKLFSESDTPDGAEKFEAYETPFGVIRADLGDVKPEEFMAMAKAAIADAVQKGGKSLLSAWTIAKTLLLENEMQILRPLVAPIEAAAANEKKQKQDQEMRSREEKEMEEYAKCSTPEQKLEFLNKYFNRDWEYEGERRNSGPQILALKGEYQTLRVREVYKDKKMAKSGEAFDKVVNVLETMPELLATWTPEMQQRVHTEAVTRINDYWGGKPMAGWYGDSRKKARELLNKYLEVGLLDFDKDEDLIDKITKQPDYR